MINLGEMEHMVQLCIWSGHLKGERPVSMMLLGNVESGKSEVLRKADGVPGVLYANDLTAWGIQHKYLPDFVSGKYHTIVIPDFITPLSKNADTADAFVTFLSGMIEEGTVRIATFATQDLSLNLPVRINIITSMAKEFMKHKRAFWATLGFMSRIVPVSYDYTPETKGAIHQYIAGGEYRTEKPFDLRLADIGQEDVELPREIAQQVLHLTLDVMNEISASAAGNLNGFRLHRQLHTLTKASALSRGHHKVDQLDFDIIKGHSQFINFNYVKV